MVGFRLRPVRYYTTIHVSNHRKSITPNPIHKAPTVFDIQLAEVKIPKVNPNMVRLSPNDWVNYGDNNLFPEFLMDSVKKSENHSAFISLRENMVKGTSITYSDNTQAFMEDVDTEGTTVEELWSSWATDMSILETFAAFVRYNKTKTAIVAIDYVDSSKVRPSKTFETDKDGNSTGKISGFWYCENWQYFRQYPPVFYQRFNPGSIDETTQLHFYHKRANGQPWVPEVSYVSCLNYVQMEDETSKFALNSMLNGFFGSAILSVKASMSDEQQQGFKSSVRNSFTGSENASKLMIFVGEGEAPQVTPLNTTDNTPQFLAFSTKAQQAIATAHRCNYALAAISTATGFNSEAALLITAQEQYQKNVIAHLQAPMITFVKKVLKFNGVKDFEFDILPLNLVNEAKVKPDFNALMDLLTPKALAKYLDIDEDDLRPEVLATEPTQPATDIQPDQIPKSPYPDAIQ